MGGPWVQAALLAAVFFLYGEISACQLPPAHPEVPTSRFCCGIALQSQCPVSDSCWQLVTTISQLQRGVRSACLG